MERDVALSTTVAAAIPIVRTIREDHTRGVDTDDRRNPARSGASLS